MNNNDLNPFNTDNKIINNNIRKERFSNPFSFTYNKNTKLNNIFNSLKTTIRKK